MTTVEVESETDDSTVPEDVSATAIVQEVLDGSVVYNELSHAFMERFDFYGQSLEAWTMDMMIDIPSPLTPDSFRLTMIELATKSQLAYNYFSVANNLAKSFNSGSELRKSDLVAILINNYMAANKKRPANAAIERMADSYMKNTISAKIASVLIKDFWHDRIESLDTVRKIMEQVGMSLNVEVRWTNQS